MQFKYEAEWARAEHLSPLLASAMEGLTAVDALVAVPLHPSRLRQRGFNQSQLLARQAGSLLQCAVEEPLERTRRTQSQARLRGVDRAANVADAFAVREGKSVDGLNVVLIDDVITTGSTLAVCALVLRNAGAASVSAATLAREL